jgi:RNA recognition motif-containing protein
MKIVQSFFIPRISVDVTKPQLKTYFQKYGMVCRVDLVSFNNDNGVGRRAYIHFQWYNFDCDIETSLKEKGYFDVFEQTFGNIRILKNKNPVPQTTLNIDQIAYNTIFTGDQVQNQQKQIEALENKVKSLETLICKLLDQESDADTIPRHGLFTSSTDDSDEAGSMAVLIPRSLD